MMRPTLKIERRLWHQGRKRVVGLDEVGVGALAGPVVVAAVCLRQGYRPTREISMLVRDSKELSSTRRQEAFNYIINDNGISWTVGRVTPSVIDRINIRQAVFLAMRRCLGRLSKTDYALVDGAAVLKNHNVPQKAIVKGDKKVFSIAAASIIAKVIRDRYMQRLDKSMPQYQFAQHKGYGTLVHRRKLRKWGLSFSHRISFCDHLQN